MVKLKDETIKEVLDEVVDKFLIPRFMQLGMKATGKWLESLEVEADNGVGYIKGEHYTEQLVFGRRGGSNPPIKPLMEWVKAKFRISDEKQVRSIAFAVQKKIAKEGTTWHKKGGSNLLEVLEEESTKDYIRERVGVFYRLQIQEQLIRDFKSSLE